MLVGTVEPVPVPPQLITLWLHRCILVYKVYVCGGTGTDSTVPTNTVQVPITTGTVTTAVQSVLGLLGNKWLYIQDR